MYKKGTSILLYGKSMANAEDDKILVKIYVYVKQVYICMVGFYDGK